MKFSKYNNCIFKIRTIPYSNPPMIHIFTSYKHRFKVPNTSKVFTCEVSAPVQSDFCLKDMQTKAIQCLEKQIDNFIK